MPNVQPSPIQYPEPTFAQEKPPTIQWIIPGNERTAQVQKILDEAEANGFVGIGLTARLVYAWSNLAFDLAFQKYKTVGIAWLRRMLDEKPAHTKVENPAKIWEHHPVEPQDMAWPEEQAMRRIRMSQAAA